MYYVSIFLFFFLLPKHMIVQEQPIFKKKQKKQKKQNTQKQNRQISPIFIFRFYFVLCFFFRIGFFLGFDGEIIEEKWKAKIEIKTKGPHSRKRRCVELYSCTLCIIAWFLLRLRLLPLLLILLQSHHSSLKQKRVNN